MTTIRKTWSEVLEGGYQAVWGLMDDETKIRFVKYAKSYLGKTTSDGVKMTWARFADATGSTASALRGYEARLRKGNDRSTSALPVEVRRARSDLMKPGVLGAILEDPKFRQKILSAAADVEPNRIPTGTGKQYEPKAEDLNTAAMVDLADMHKYAKRANENADYSSLTDHQLENAEVFIQATETEIAVWREQVEGGLSDDALRRLTEGV